MKIQIGESINCTHVHACMSGGLALTIPLLLLERSVNLAEIGIILSILPLIFLATRLFLAALADQLGWAQFYLLLNWPGTFLSTLIYLLANSTPAFLLGRIVEAVKVSSYWPVGRTAIFSLSPDQKGKEATRNNAVLWLSIAVGSAVSGIGITFMGFSFTLGILILASAIMGIPAALLWRERRKGSKLEVTQAFALLNPRGRGKTFWLTSLIMMFLSLAYYPLTTLLLPVFMVELSLFVSCFGSLEFLLRD